MSENKTKKEAKTITKKYIVDWINYTTECEFKYSAIHFACYQGKSDVIRKLHMYGADLNVKSTNGISPIHLAA